MSYEESKIERYFREKEIERNRKLLERLARPATREELLARLRGGAKKVSA